MRMSEARTVRRAAGFWLLSIAVLGADGGLAQPAGPPSATRPWAVDVRAHGAVGDGTADDGPALQAALDAVAAAGGRVIVPPGVYRTSRSLFLGGNNVSLVGAGAASRIMYVGAGGPVLGASPRAHTSGMFTYHTYCKVEDLFLLSDTADVGLDITGFSYSTFRDLVIQLRGSNRKLVLGQGHNGHSPYYNVLDAVTLIGNNDGAGIAGSVGFAFEPGQWTGGSNGPNANLIANVKRIAAVDFGFDLRAGNGNLGVNISLESIRVAAFRLNFNPPVESGRASGGDGNKLLDASKAWPRNAWVNASVVLIAGPGAGQIRRIANNVAGQLTVRRPWSSPPGSGTTYEIYAAKGIKNKFVNLRQEGGGPRPVDFIRSHPGAFGNSFTQYTVESLRGGAIVADAERDPSNKYGGEDE
jgi:hypothetical protein